MFANRFTAFVDACTLAGALKRNMLLSLAEADFFRIRWSAPVLEETQRAIASMLTKKGVADAEERAARAIAAMRRAFADADVAGFEPLLSVCVGLPDPNDAHVIAAALKTQAAVIVTDNIKDFPSALLSGLNLEARTADTFIADTIALDTGRAVAAIRTMRRRLNRPEKTAETLLLDMEANSLTETVDVLRTHIASL
jgi:hypothetical protein